MRNIPALDGLRGLAVLLVILFHAKLVSFGWIGVAIFYVLSSFLITSILRAERGRSPGDYFGKFWKRRACRLLPLYYGYLAILGLLFLGRNQGFHWLGLVTFTFNFSQIALPVVNPAIGHFWSLSVEAQFYVVWPLCVRLFGDRALQRLCVAMILLGPAARFGGDVALAHLTTWNGVAGAPNFLLPTSHLEVFGWGALFALSPIRDRPSVVIGIWCAALSLATLPFAPHAVWTGLFVGLGCAGLLAIGLNPRFSKSLSAGWLQYTGRISYGLYVLHYALCGWLEYAWPVSPRSSAGLARAAILLAMSYAAASLSFFLWERRFLGGRHWTEKVVDSPLPQNET